MADISAGDGRTLTICTRFDDLPQPYRELFDQVSGGSHFFLTLPWFRHLAETSLAERYRLLIYCIESESRAGLVLPMCHEINRNRFFGARRLAALTNYYTPLFAPVVKPSDMHASKMLTAIIQSIATGKPQWDVIDCHPLDVDSATFGYFLTAFHSARMPVQRYFCFGNWYLDVNGRSYQEYFNGLGSKLRNTVTRRAKQLLATGGLHIEIVSDSANIENSIAAYEEVYRSSWKEAEVFSSFIPGLIRSNAVQGTLRLGLAYINDQPAAAQIWIVHKKTASIYKLAYAEQFSKLSIGTVLTSRMMQHVIDIDKVQEIDYLSGDDAYKKDWMSHRRERWGVVAFNLRTLRGIVAAGNHFGRRLVMRLYRKMI